VHVLLEQTHGSLTYFGVSASLLEFPLLHPLKKWRFRATRGGSSRLLRDGNQGDALAEPMKERVQAGTMQGTARTSVPPCDSS
jgi:hypothetical protein